MESPSEIAGLKAWFDASDRATLWQNSGGTGAVAATGDPIGQWRDKSGNGWHLTQPTDALRGKYDAVSWGGAVHFFGGRFLRNTSFSLAQPNTVFLRFYIPRRWATDRTNNDEVIYGDDGVNWNAFFTVNNSYSTFQGSLDDTHGTRIYAGGSLHTPAQILSSVPHVLCLEFDTTDSTMRLNGSSLLSATSIGTKTKTHLAVGAHSGGTVPAKVLVSELIIYDRLLTEEEKLAVEAYLESKAFAGKPNVVFDGDSHTRGYTPNGQLGDYPMLLMQSLSRTAAWHNRGVPGQTSSQMAGDAATDIDSRVKSAASRNVLVVCIGANDLGTAVSLATLKSNIQSYVTARRSAGFDKIITLHIPPHNQVSGYTEANWNNLGDWLEALTSGADANVDIRDDADIGSWGANTNATYYGADIIHLNDAGNAKLAALVKPLLEAVIAVPSSAIINSCLRLGLGNRL